MGRSTGPWDESSGPGTVRRVGREALVEPGFLARRLHEQEPCKHHGEGYCDNGRLNDRPAEPYENEPAVDRVTDQTVRARFNEFGIVMWPGQRRQGTSEVDDSTEGEYDATSDQHGANRGAHEPQRPRPVGPERPACRGNNDEQHALDEDPSLPARAERRQTRHDGMLGPSSAAHLLLGLFDAEGPESVAGRQLLGRMFLVSRLELVSFVVIIALMVFKPGS